MRRAVAASLALAFLAAPALADEVLLRNGRTLKGAVTDTGDRVVVEDGRTRMELRRDEVASITRTPTARERYAARRAALETKDAEGWHRLGLWAGFQGLAAEARACHEAALAADAEHAGARRELGFVREAGRWIAPASPATPAEGVDAARDALRREALARAAAAKEEERLARLRLRDALRLLQSPRASHRALGERAFTALGEERGDPHMVAVAPEVRAWYDRWHAERAARALLQVNATLTTLKRPIPKFTTSLGAFSSPVTIQLPEISVIRINTFAVVPLGWDE